MTPESTLTELRDTLAIEITKEIAGKGIFGTGIKQLEDAFKGVYPWADLVLSGRDRPQSTTRAPRLTHCPVCDGMAAGPTESHAVPSIEHPGKYPDEADPKHCPLCANLPGQHGKHETGTVEHPTQEPASAFCGDGMGPYPPRERIS
jgi:hypothetical protein